MRKQKGLILGVILLAIILMAVGYAALGGDILTINANAQASANAENFKVYFTGANTEKSDDTEGNIDVTVTSGSDTATVSFNKALGLNAMGDTAYAILEIENASEGIDAESVKVTTPATDTDIFDFEAVMCDESGNAVSGENPVASQGKTYVKVSVTLKTSPTDDTEVISATMKITATPEANV